MPNAPVFAKMPRKYKQRKITDFTKKVTAIAKKAIHKEAETKSPMNNLGAGINMIPDIVYATNLTYFIAQGNSAETIDGEKVFVKNIRLKGLVFAFNSATVTNTPTTFRLMVIKTKQPLTNTNAPITASDVFRLPVPAYTALQGHLDTHRVDILYDKVINFGQPNQANVIEHKGFEINLKINKTHFIDQENGGYFKDKNYYLVYTLCKSDAAVVNTSGVIRCQWSINLKDM